MARKLSRTPSIPGKLIVIKYNVSIFLLFCFYFSLNSVNLFLIIVVLLSLVYMLLRAWCRRNH